MKLSSKLKLYLAKKYYNLWTLYKKRYSDIVLSMDIDELEHLNFWLYSKGHYIEEDDNMQ